MSKNRLKDTAGRSLVGYAVLVAVVVAASLWDWWSRMYDEVIRLPTAIEDLRYYDPEAVEGGGVELKFWAAPDGLVRAGEELESKTDALMWKLGAPQSSPFPTDESGFAMDEGGRYYFYRYEKDGFDERTGLPERIYVKVDDGKYLRFEPAGGGVGGDVGGGGGA